MARSGKSDSETDKKPKSVTIDDEKAEEGKSKNPSFIPNDMATVVHAETSSEEEDNGGKGEEEDEKRKVLVASDMMTVKYDPTPLVASVEPQDWKEGLCYCSNLMCTCREPTACKSH